VIASYIVTPFAGIQARAGSQITVTYAPSSPLENAVNLAKSVDIAIVVVGTISSEGRDRTNLTLGDQDELVAAVAQAQPSTVVVVHTPGAVLMPWVDQVAAIVCSFMPGQEDGNAIASILFGDINPSGKLPVSFPMTEDQIPVNTTQQYPGINDEADYSKDYLLDIDGMINSMLNLYSHLVLDFPTLNSNIQLLKLVVIYCKTLQFHLEFKTLVKLVELKLFNFTLVFLSKHLNLQNL